MSMMRSDSKGSEKKPRRATNRFSCAIAAASACFFGVVLLVNLHLPEFSIPEHELLSAVPSKAFCKRLRPPIVCAHGGDASTARANTRHAFLAAIETKVDCVEIDVARSNDDQLVVLHVRELSELLGGAQGVQVGDFNWTQLAEKRWPEGGGVMLVEEAVHLASPFFTTVILDIKTYQDEAGHAVDEQRMADLVTLLVHRTGCSNCLVWAKSDNVVRAVRYLSPGQRVGLVLMNGTEEARDLGMDKPMRIQGTEVVAGHYPMADPLLIDQLAAAGKLLFVWTVNDPAVMRRMLDVGVDGIVTNKPALVQSAVEQRLRGCGTVLYSQKGGS